MGDLLVITADATAGTTGTLLVITTTITALGVLGAAALAIYGQRSSFRRDKEDAVLSYKRHIYRNYLDHAYWYRSESLSDEERQKRAEKYVADWHRIQLIADSEVRELTKPWKKEGSLSVADEEPLIEAFKRELGLRGLE